MFVDDVMTWVIFGIRKQLLLAKKEEEEEEEEEEDKKKRKKKKKKKRRRRRRRFLQKKKTRSRSQCSNTCSNSAKERCSSVISLTMLSGFLKT